jgi:TolB-like protein
MKKLLSISLVTLFSTSCAFSDFTIRESEIDLSATQIQQTESLHQQVEKLARQLLITSQLINHSSTIAVGTILPTMHSGGTLLPPDAAFGLQIQESLITFVTQAGLNVLEYKAMPAIKISKQTDRMLSRDVNELNTNIATDYFLTGNFTTQEHSTMVNIRLIQIPENIVLAAATDYVPNNSMWSASKVSLKHNKIYRNAN